MTVLYISEVTTDTDDLGRWVTTLTQEVMCKINNYEENIFLDTLRQLEETTECISYRNDNDTELEVWGNAVKKAMETVNSVAGHKLLAPVTEIYDGSLYRIEIEY